MGSILDTVLDDPAVSGGLVVGAVVAVVLWPTVVRRTEWSRWWTLPMLLGIAWYVATTLTPSGGHFGSTTSVGQCLTDVVNITGSLDRMGGEQIWANVLFTMPAAFFTVLATRRTWPVALIGLLVPAVVEVLQSTLLARECDGTDWVAAAGGAVLGAVLATASFALPQLWQPKEIVEPEEPPPPPGRRGRS